MAQKAKSKVKTPEPKPPPRRYRAMQDSWSPAEGFKPKNTIITLDPGEKPSDWMLPLDDRPEVGTLSPTPSPPPKADDEEGETHPDTGTEPVETERAADQDAL